jgi:AcrR family transcriptional regulator
MTRRVRRTNGNCTFVVDNFFGNCERLKAVDRREQLLEVAAGLFASTGLRGTTTAALAAGARISEPVLYAHFQTKDMLFRETVERNIDKRVQKLERQLAAVSSHNLIECVERMAEATVGVCVSHGANALLTCWALLEAPEYANDLHRREVGSIHLMWEHELADRFPDSEHLSLVRGSLLPYTIQACVAYGFWLAAFRHSAESAAPLVRQFVDGTGDAAATLIGSSV